MFCYHGEMYVSKFKYICVGVVVTYDMYHTEFDFIIITVVKMIHGCLILCKLSGTFGTLVSKANPIHGLYGHCWYQWALWKYSCAGIVEFEVT